MTFTAEDWWVVGTAVITAWACVIPGTFLFLRRMALLSDAVSHGILPGIIIAFILTNDRSPLPMITGAAIAGILTAIGASFLTRTRTVKSDTAMGIVFPSFFALGVLLITWKARDVDLDPGCVLYGLIEFIPFDIVTVGGIDVPRGFLNVFYVLIANLIFIGLFYKELILTSFDPGLARSLGFSSRLLEYGLLFSLTATAVVAFEAIGSILVLTFLVAPIATAVLLTTRMRSVLAVSTLVGTAGAIGGYAGALKINTSAAGMMSTVMGLIFIGALLFSPQVGLLGTVIGRARLRMRIAREDLLASLYKGLPLEERRVRRTRDRVLFRIAERQLLRRGMIEGSENARRLTDDGKKEAEHIVRVHRLWEAYLKRNTALPLDHLHEPSDRVEHFIGEQLEGELTASLKADTDPHGREIP